MYSDRLTHKVVMENLTEVRENIQGDLRKFYSKVFLTDLDSVQAIKKYGLALLDSILSEESEEAEKSLEVARGMLSRMIDVPNFIGEENAEVEYEKSFDYLVNSVVDSVGVSVRKGTVREFYSLYEYLLKKWSSKKR